MEVLKSLKEKKKLIYIGSGLAALAVIIIIAAAVLLKKEPEEEVIADVPQEVLTEESGDIDILVDTLFVQKNTISFPVLQMLPIYEEWGALTWESRDPEIADGTESGLIEAFSAGETTLTGTSEDQKLRAYMDVLIEELPADVIEPDDLQEEPEPEQNMPDKLVLEIMDYKVSTELMDAFFEWYEGVPEIEEDQKVDETLEDLVDLGAAELSMADLAAGLVWTSTDPEIAAVSDTGVITFFEAGLASIEAKDKEGNIWAAMDIYVYYEEEVLLTGLEAQEKELEVAVNETLKPEIIYTPENTTEKILLWSSSDSSVAEVSMTGEITGINEGSCTITAVSPRDESLALEWKVTVKYVELESIAAATANVIVAENASIQANVVFVPANASERELEWSSADISVASVDGEGRITGVKTGNTSVTATAKNNNSLKAVFQVSVTRDVTINTEGVQVVVYKGSQTVGYYRNGELIRSMVCSTGKPGQETPNGEYTIPAKYGNWYYFRSVGCWIQYGIGIRGDYLFHSIPYYPPAGTAKSDYNGYMSVYGYSLLGSKASGGCVRMTVADLKWLYENVAVGTKLLVTEASGPAADTGVPPTSLANGRTYHWDPTDPNPNNPYRTAVSSIALSENSIQLTEGDSKVLSASYSPSTAAASFSYSSSDASVASVDGNGNVTAKKAGSATITVRETNSGLTASCSVTVKERTISVTGITLSSASAVTLKMGEQSQINAAASPSNATNRALVFSSGNNAVATVDGNGKITAVGEGTVTITIASKENGNIKTTVTVTVEKEEPQSPDPGEENPEGEENPDEE